MNDWPFFISGRQDIIFVHIPKTAGTSIRYAMGFNEMNKSQNIRNHYTAKEIINLIGIEKWNSAFKFSFVRNPWDRLYSFYSFRLMKGRIKDKIYKDSFRAWVLSELVDRDPKSKKRFNLIPQTAWLIGPQNNIQMDFIGRFENLAEDYKKLCSLISFDSELPKMNKSIRANNYKLKYDPELEEIVAQYYQSDLDYFGYKLKNSDTKL